MTSDSAEASQEMIPEVTVQRLFEDRHETLQLEVLNSDIGLILPAIFIGSMYWGIAPAAVQEMMPNQMRGRASAVYLFIVNLVGLAFGPQILALLTDYVFADESKVHYSLVVVGGFAHLAAGILLFLCLRRFRASVSYLERWQSARA